MELVDKGAFMKRIIMTLLILFMTVSVIFANEAGKVRKTGAAEEIRLIVAAKSSLINELNRAVWSYAEPGYQEFKSAAKHISILESEGFNVEKEIAGIKTAFVARYGSGSPVIGFLAEYDALPNLSQKGGCPVKTPLKNNTNGHGCGHSVLGAGAVGGAIAVKEYLKRHPEIKGTVVLYGTPAEEGGCGKTFMAKRGCFRDLDLFYSWHPSTSNGVASYKTLAYYQVKYVFDGISAHAGGAPDRGRSALDACELMNVGVNYLREHVPTSSRIHYAYLDCGGSAPNVVQDHTEILYYIRGIKISDCDQLLERINNIARGAALMTDTKVTIKFYGGLSDFVTNTVAASALNQALHEMGGPVFEEPEYALARLLLEKSCSPEEKTARIERSARAEKIKPEEFALRPLEKHINGYNPKAVPFQTFASTDDGDVSQLVPGARFNLVNGIPGSPSHSWIVTSQSGSSIGDKCAQGAARVFARAAVMIFENPELVQAAQKEWSEKLGGKYKSPIPDKVNPGEF